MDLDEETLIALSGTIRWEDRINKKRETTQEKRVRPPYDKKKAARAYYLKNKAKQNARANELAKQRQAAFAARWTNTGRKRRIK